LAVELDPDLDPVARERDPDDRPFDPGLDGDRLGEDTDPPRGSTSSAIL
jgi:hypothetical protein